MLSVLDMANAKEGKGKRPHGGDSEDEAPLETKKPKKDYSVWIEFKVNDFRQVDPFKATKWIHSLIGDDCSVVPIKAKKAIKVTCTKHGSEVLMGVEKEM